MKVFSLVLLLAFPFLLNAQLGFEDFTTVPCSFGDLSIVLPDGWLAYQTVDDQWDGEPESGVCISMLQGSSSENALLQLDDALEDKPVFLSRTLDVDLAANDMWSVLMDWDSNAYASLLTDCADSLSCSELLFRIQVPNHPDSVLTVTDDLRSFPFKESEPLGFGTIQGVAGCLPTQYFEEQTLIEVIYVLYPDWEIAGNEIEIPALAIEQVPYFNLIDESTFYDYYSHSYNSELDTHYYFTNWDHQLVTYNPEDGYPSSDNISFIDIQPDDGVASDTQQNIQVELGIPGDWDQIVVSFQPHTFFRGALVEGSDSIRHNLELVFANAELCGPLLVDYPLEPGNGLVFHEGAVEFGKRNCFIINDAAYLEVAKEGALNYGLDGIGMLAMHPGSEVILESGAYLQFGNSLVLADKSVSEESTHCDIYLHPGSVFSFTEKARVVNLSPDERQKIRVHLLGGAIDYTELSAEERSHFEFIEYEDERFVGVEILGNPTSGPIRFRFDAASKGQSQISVLDQLGNLLYSDQVSHVQGENEFILPKLNTSGVVLLRIDQDNHSMIKRVLLLP
jgi:hypothetical protein